MTNPAQPDFAAGVLGFPYFQRVSRGDTTAFAARNGGSAHVEIWHQGIKVHNVIHFTERAKPTDPLFRGGASVTVLPDGDVLIGAGYGGGARYKRISKLATGWAQMSDQFLGGKIGAESRHGCMFLPDGRPVYGYAEQNVTLPVQPFIATPWRTLAGDTLNVNAFLSQIPIELQKRMVREGAKVHVYRGKAITDMEEFQHLKGQKTQMEGDGNRTWDQVPGRADGVECWVTENGLHLMHEVGHIIEVFLWRNDEARSSFSLLWRNNQRNWTTPYERTNIREAAAECINRHIERPESNNHLFGIRGYLERYLPEATTEQS